MRILYSGMFDLLHYGHIMAFKEIKKKGTLIVHVASDKETKCVKGGLRPIIPGNERAEMVRAIRYVDEVYYKEKYESEFEVAKKVKADAIVRNVGNKDKFDLKVIYVKRFVPKSKLDTSGIIKKIQSYEAERKPAGVNYVLLVKDEILLQRRDKKKGIRCPGMLAIPGGNLEEGENTHTAILRELEEETGVRLHGDRVKFITDLTYPWGQVGRYFLIKLNKKPKITEGEGKMEWHKLNKKLKVAANQKLVLELLCASMK